MFKFIFRSEQVLKELCPETNILNEIETLIRTWPFSSVTELREIRNDLQGIISEIKNKFFQTEVNLKVFCAIHW